MFTDAFNLLLKRSVPSKIITVNQKTFFSNRIDDYLYRPLELEHVNWYDFVAGYDVRYMSRSNQNDMMHFNSKEHPLFNVNGVRARKHTATPIVHYYDFPCASTFSGNILSENYVQNTESEKFAYGALCLFVPFRDPEPFQSIQGSSFTQKLQHAVRANALSGESITRLQNVQNCHNMMKAG